MSDPLYQEAMKRFQALFQEAASTDLSEPTAMTLATADADGRPSARTVLLKDVDERGFVFYTNKRSRKAGQLSANPRAALCFYWQPLKQQVHVEGEVVDVSDAEADDYWMSRPLESRLGGWASQQSEPLGSFDALMARYQDFEQKFASAVVPRPAHWSGYRVVPDRLEFWKAGMFRLHRRHLYQRGEDGVWSKSLLNP